LIEIGNREISIARQCELLGMHRSAFYYQKKSVSVNDLNLMQLIDEQFTQTPFYGSRRLCAVLREKGHIVNRKKMRRLMQEMGLESIYPKPNLSKSNKLHKKYPYLLRGFLINKPGQVWSEDITYVRLEKGFAYLTAIIDWFSRYVLSWRLSNLLDSDFCLETLDEALRQGKPDIFNTDQGVQFTSKEFTQRLEDQGILISMDGKGRALDNIFVERLWRSVKYEDIYLRDYKTMQEAQEGLNRYFEYYNLKRPHQSLNYKKPYEVHFGF
jgi:putative transposase